MQAPGKPSDRLVAVGATLAGIAIYSLMDTAMKRLAIDSGAYAAVLWRSVVGVALTGAAFLARQWWEWGRGRERGRRWPDRAATKLHVARGLASGASVLLFFWGMARVPMAQSVALTFVAPLLAIFLAAAMLGERVRRAAVTGSGVASLGVLVIAAGEVHAGASTQVVLGTIAIVVASILYAASLVLLRRQAQDADPLEITLYTSLVTGALMLPAAPWLAGWPTAGQVPAIVGAAVLGTVSAMLIAWAYARAQAQVLAPVEYTAFLWAAVFGWLSFGERVSAWTVAGALLIVAGCAVAVRERRPATEAAA